MAAQPATKHQYASGLPTTTSMHSRPSMVPRRTSSLSTRSRPCSRRARSDLINFHRQSCQMFSSLDKTLAETPISLPGSIPRSSTSTSTENGGFSGWDSKMSTRQTSLDEDCKSPSNKHNSSYTNLFHSSDSASKSFSPDVVFNDMTQNWLRGSNVVTSSDEEDADSSSHSQQEAKDRILLPRAAISTAPICWTSASTRKKQYAKIDAAHTGIRGLLKKILPKAVACRRKRNNFYEEHADSDSDGGSVRRFRIGGDDNDQDNEIENEKTGGTDLSDDKHKIHSYITETNDETTREKDVVTSRIQTICVPVQTPSQPPVKARAMTGTGPRPLRRRLSCFSS